MNEETFFTSLRENPGDELTWQALADWLDDSGQSDRAELLRLMRRSLTMPVNERADVQARIVELLEGGVKPVVVERVNSIGMRFALIPAGRFLMGSPPDEPDRQENEVLHEVTLTKPFWLGVFPVTQKQWKAVMGNNPSYFCTSGGGKDEVKGMDTDDFPVENVSWEDAQDFLKKLNGAPEDKYNRRKYQLPSEAEWEYSCRSGADVKYPFSFKCPCSSLSSAQANFDGNFPYGDADEGPNLGHTCKVGSYEANPFGLYDMHGNVWEWCADRYGLHSPGAVTDPSGPPSGSRRVNRGGSWYNPGRYCRSANRYSSMPSSRNIILGFRVAAVPSSG